MIEFPCPHCGIRTKAPEEYAGRQGRCTSCKQKVRIPTQSQSERPSAPRAKAPDSLALPPATKEQPEQEVHRLRPSWKVLYEQMVIIMILSVLVSIVFGAFGESIGIGFLAFIPSMLVMGGVGALWALLNRHGNLLILTDKRCTLERGILSRATSEVRHTDVRNIQVTRGFIDRLFNIGTLGISTAAQSDVEIAIKGIDEPYRIRDLIDGYHG